MRNVMKIVSILLVVAMLLTASVFAAEIAQPSNTTKEENKKMIVYSYGGATATFENGTTGEDEYVTVTYEDSTMVEGNQYLVLVLVSEDGTVSTEDYDEKNISYIDQMAALKNATTNNAYVQFKIYPDVLKDSVVMIIGLNKDKQVSQLKAAIIDAKYIIGDVSGDGIVDLEDAVMILRHIASLNTLTAEQQAAADVDGGGSPDLTDVVRILRWYAKLNPTL